MIRNYAQNCSSTLRSREKRHFVFCPLSVYDGLRIYDCQTPEHGFDCILEMSVFGQFHLRLSKTFCVLTAYLVLFHGMNSTGLSNLSFGPFSDFRKGTPVKNICRNENIPENSSFYFHKSRYNFAKLYQIPKLLPECMALL